MKGPTDRGKEFTRHFWVEFRISLIGNAEWETFFAVFNNVCPPDNDVSVKGLLRRWRRRYSYNVPAACSQTQDRRCLVREAKTPSFNQKDFLRHIIAILLAKKLAACRAKHVYRVCNMRAGVIFEYETRPTYTEDLYFERDWKLSSSTWPWLGLFARFGRGGGGGGNYSLVVFFIWMAPRASKWLDGWMAPFSYPSHGRERIKW